MVAKIRKDNSMLTDKDLIMKNIQQYCPGAYTSLMNLITVTNATLSKLPPHVQDILDQVTSITLIDYYQHPGIT